MPKVSTNCTSYQLASGALNDGAGTAASSARCAAACFAWYFCKYQATLANNVVNNRKTKLGIPGIKPRRPITPAAQFNTLRLTYDFLINCWPTSCSVLTRDTVT